MLKKLLSIYHGSILLPNLPKNQSEKYFYFYSDTENLWIGLPKTEVSDKELILLKTLFSLVEFHASNLAPLAKEWYDFLLLDSPPPPHYAGSNLRFIQFYINGTDANQMEIESALKGFFTEEVLIIWENERQGIVIEEKKQISLSEEELISMTETLESDFYVKISFFIGKLHVFSGKLRAKFLQEKEYFLFAINNLGNHNIFTFERVFPAFLAYYLPVELKEKACEEIIEVFVDDPEMFSTIKVFLENNLNASLTAKKLYIHRNTLQYRIDKFSEKTGIGLKDFYGAFTVFLACLLFEYKNVK
jgi:hypothetical protein